MAVFEYLRVSLIEPLDSQNDLFAAIVPKPTRREYLETLFDLERHDFVRYGKPLSFIKDRTIGDIIVGRIGKKVSTPEHDGPEQRYALRIHDKWHPVWVFFDLASDSQLMVVEKGARSNSPIGLAESLFESLAEKKAKSYEIFIEYVSRTEEFWSAVEANRGKITRLEFAFVPPNALGLDEAIKEIVDIAKKDSKAEITKFVHTNKDGGLEPKGDYIEAALSKAGEGAGSVTMKAGGKTIFSSSTNRKTTTVAADDVPKEPDEGALTRLMGRLFGTKK